MLKIGCFVQMMEIGLHGNSQKNQVTKIYVVLNKCEIFRKNPYKGKDFFLITCSFFAMFTIPLFRKLIYRNKWNALKKINFYIMRSNFPKQFKSSRELLL